MKRIKITKLEGKKESHIDPGYWVDGWMRKEPEVGHKLLLWPINATSLMDRFDWFMTTELTEIKGDVVTTTNSKWRIEYL